MRTFAILAALALPALAHAGWPSIEAISAGTNHACAISGGKVYCWGGNEDRQLGDDSTRASDKPVEVIGVRGATQIASGDLRTCAIAQSDRDPSKKGVWCWGETTYPSKARSPKDAYTIYRFKRPVEIPGLEGATSVDVGGWHSCAVKEGKVYCWGVNVNGQVQPGGSIRSREREPGIDVPGEPVHGVDDAVQVSLGLLHSCALTRKGDVYCWGANDQGTLGYEATGSAQENALGLAPARKVPGLSKVIALSGYSFLTCALSEERLKCWGTHSADRDELRMNVGAVGSLTAGHDYACAVINGENRCWGVEPSSARSLDQIAAISLKYGRVREVSAGGFRSCAIVQEVIEENIYCWGHDGANGPDRKGNDLGLIKVPAPTPAGR